MALRRFVFYIIKLTSHIVKLVHFCKYKSFQRSIAEPGGVLTLITIKISSEILVIWCDRPRREYRAPLTPVALNGR